jgi:hypothetical protein
MGSGSQQAVGDGDQRDMPGYRGKVPDLILIEALRFAFFVIDFNGPAMAADTRDTGGLPVQLVGDEEPGGIGEVGLAMVDD